MNSLDWLLNSIVNTREKLNRTRLTEHTKENYKRQIQNLCKEYNVLFSQGFRPDTWSATGYLNERTLLRGLNLKLPTPKHQRPSKLVFPGMK